MLGPHTACGMVQAGACVAACHCRPRWQGVSARARVSMSVSVSVFVSVSVSVCARVSVPVSVSVGSVSVYLRLSCVLVSAQVCKCKCVFVCVPVSGSRYVPACRPAWPCVCVHVSVSVSLSTYVHAWALCKMPTLPPSLSPPHPPSSFSLSLSHSLPVQNRVRRYQEKKALVLRHSGCACFVCLVS